MMIWSECTTGQKPVTVNVPSRDALLNDLARRFDEGQGFTVATLNLDHVVKLARDPDFRCAYAAQSHVTADGNPIAWLARLAGQHDVTLVPGSDLITPVAALAAEKRVPVALFGATEASLTAAAHALETGHPALEVTLCLAPPMGFDPGGVEAGEMIGAIRDSRARLVFVALGAPKQECFAARAAAVLPETGFLSIGAGLDFISGAQNRAPKWVRAIAAEWIWRLAASPQRLAGRYGACMLALPRLTLQAMVIRWRKRASAA